MTGVQTCALPILYWKKELKLQFMEEHNIIDNIETAKKNTKEQLLQIIQENSQIKFSKMKGTKFQNHCHLYDTVFIDILAAYTYIINLLNFSSSKHPTNIYD